MRNFHLSISLIILTTVILFAQKQEQFKLENHSKEEINISYKQNSFEQKNIQINNKTHNTI